MNMSGIHQSRRTCVPLVLPTDKVYISVIPVALWSCLHQNNTASLSDLQDCLMWTRKHIKNSPAKKATYTIQNESYMIHCPPSTASHLAKAQTKPHFDDHHSNNALSRRAYLPYLFSEPLNIYISVPPVLFWSCLHQKNTTSFSDLQNCLIGTWKYTWKPPGEKYYAYHPERILEVIVSTIHGFSTLAASMYCLSPTASLPLPQTVNLKQ